MGLDIQTLMDLKNGNKDFGGREMVFDPETKQFVYKRTDNNSINKSNNDYVVKLTAEDANMFAFSDNSVLVINEWLLEQIISSSAEGDCQFFSTKDEGEVITLVQEECQNSIKGKILVNGCIEDELSAVDEDVIVLIKPIEGGDRSQSLEVKIAGLDYTIEALVKYNGSYQPINIDLVPIKEKLFLRTDGLYETGKLADSHVVIIGLGSGGSPVALELVKAGVMNFSLIDDDRLEIVNVVRHICGISDLGRYKTKAVKELMLDKNPYANIDTYEFKADSEHVAIMKNIIASCDLVICATDNQESKRLINQICINENKTCIYGGAFRRAGGGQVLRVIPKQTMCYECFLKNLSNQFSDGGEISNQRQVAGISYSDRIVPIEPGLSTDIAPISNFMTKLAILELLKGKEHSMNSLYEDLSCSFYLWVNRREFQFAEIDPMKAGIGFSILRWYGIKTEQDKNCLACNDISRLIDNEDLDYFS